MRVPGPSDAHLTYCLNVHPGATLAEAEAAIFERARRVFDEFSRLAGVSGPFGLGMWFSAEAARELSRADGLDQFARKLHDAGFYAFTLNGFPFGRFHGTRVKEKVYQPDWADEARFDYTISLIAILARLLPKGVHGTISTLPVTFKPWADEAKLARAARNLAEVAARLDVVREAGGKEIALALEPEPGCYLEKAEHVVRFFHDHLVPAARKRLGRERKECDEILRRHVGVCLDTVHAGVMGETPAKALGRLTSHDIRVLKVQLGAALRVEVGPEGPPPALSAFRDEVYLHQVTVRAAGKRLFFADLPDALDQPAPPRGEWRVHFHVPLAWPGEGAIATTSGEVNAAFFEAAVAAGVEHFESEIYTLDVFPGRTASTETILAQDLAWIWHRLRAAGS
jgi:sugar phosphate isomerase/epimerase